MTTREKKLLDRIESLHEKSLTIGLTVEEDELLAYLAATWEKEYN